MPFQAFKAWGDSSWYQLATGGSFVQMSRLLEAHGHRVSMAIDGETGLKLYRERPFDLVISDVVMPGMSGTEFMERLRAIDSQAQVLVMTGQTVSTSRSGTGRSPSISPGRS